MSETNDWDSFWCRLSYALTAIADDLRRTFPDLHFVAGRVGTATFPFRAYATFKRDSESEAIDISIDWKLVDGYVSVSADTARENGMVLSEYPEFAIPIEAIENIVHIEHVFDELISYAQTQTELIRRTLAQ